MTKTEQRRLVKELRAEAQAFINQIDNSTYGPLWLSDRLGNIDGISAMLRESLEEEEDYY